MNEMRESDSAKRGRGMKAMCRANDPSDEGEE